MDRRLGRPLPHQLPNPTRADPKAINLSPFGHIRYCSQFPGNIPYLRARSHALLTRLPLPLRGVRLACVKPAASVRSEPESNSQVELIRLVPIRGSRRRLAFAFDEDRHPLPTGVNRSETKVSHPENTNRRYQRPVFLRSQDVAVCVSLLQITMSKSRLNPRAPRPGTQSFPPRFSLGFGFRRRRGAVCIRPSIPCQRSFFRTLTFLQRPIWEAVDP